MVEWVCVLDNCARLLAVVSTICHLKDLPNQRTTRALYPHCCICCFVFSGQYRAN